jgi:hypothetical protein
MMSPIVRLSKWISENQAVSYLFGLVAGAVAFLAMLIIANWDFQNLINLVITQEFLIFAGVVTRFLSGSGIMLTYALVCVIIFKALSGWVKGKPARARNLKLALLIPILAVLFYAATIMVRSLIYSQPLTEIERITSLLGSWFLIVLVYALPVIRGEYDPEIRRSQMNGIKKTADNVRFKIWKGYQSYIRRDYGTVYSREFERYREQLDTIRAILSGVLILPLAFLLVFFPLLTGVALVLWFRMFSLDQEPFSGIERALLLIVALGVIVLFGYMFLVLDLSGLMLYFDVAYSIGILSSISLLGIIIYRS